MENDTLAERIAKNRDIFDAGFDAGESSVNADWIHALTEIPETDAFEDIDGPSDAVRVIRSILQRMS